MNPFSYSRADTVHDAITALMSDPQAKLLAGGTNLVDLMKYDVVHPSAIVDISHLPLNQIEALPDGGLRIGALVSNSAVAYNPRVRRDYPLLSSAILAGASPQRRRRFVDRRVLRLRRAGSLARCPENVARPCAGDGCIAAC
jgi:xanthine dehydrogenase YagS FAD-binding subunit